MLVGSRNNDGIYTSHRLVAGYDGQAESAGRLVGEYEEPVVRTVGNGLVDGRLQLVGEYDFLLFHADFGVQI